MRNLLPMIVSAIFSYAVVAEAQTVYGPRDITDCKKGILQEIYQAALSKGVRELGNDVISLKSLYQADFVALSYKKGLKKGNALADVLYDGHLASEKKFRELFKTLQIDDRGSNSTIQKTGERSEFYTEDKLISKAAAKINEISWEAAGTRDPRILEVIGKFLTKIQGRGAITISKYVDTDIFSGAHSAFGFALITVAPYLSETNEGLCFEKHDSISFLLRTEYYD